MLRIGKSPVVQVLIVKRSRRYDEYLFAFTLPSRSMLRHYSLAGLKILLLAGQRLWELPTVRAYYLVVVKSVLAEDIGRMLIGLS